MSSSLMKEILTHLLALEWDTLLIFVTSNANLSLKKLLITFSEGNNFPSPNLTLLKERQKVLACSVPSPFPTSYNLVPEESTSPTIIKSS